MIKLFGTTYRLHPLFVLLMLASLLTGYFIELITLFTIVLIHELGHVACAKGFGWRVVRVDLLPFGGVASTDELGNVPAREEIAVAIAGPLQNGWMIGLAFILRETGVWSAEWAHFFIQANLTIAVFNLLPVLPLDGGRILQACLSCWLQYHRTLLLCAAVSIAVSCGVIGAALYRIGSGGLQLNLLLIGLFLLYSNWHAYRNVTYHFIRFLLARDGQMASLLSRGTVAIPIVVRSHESISRVVRLLVKEKYHMVYVVGESGDVQAVLPEQQVVAGFLERKPGSAVSELFM